MTSAERTEDLIRKARRTTRVDVDERIMARAETALAQRKQAHPAHQHTSGLIRRIIMNNNRIRLATAAAVMAAALLGVYALTGSFDGASITVAQVREAMEGIDWMKIINEGDTVGDGRVELDMFSFASRVHIKTDMEGRTVYQDFQSGKQFHWTPGSDSIDESPLDANREFARGAAGPFAMMDQSLRLIQAERDAELTKELGTRDGRQVEIWTAQWSNNGAGASRTLTVYVDTVEKRPVAATFEHGQAGGGSYRESNIEFEYPEVGPANIYQAGAPESASIVSTMKK